MLRIRDPNIKHVRLQYNRLNLRRAYDAVIDGMAVCKAATLYSIPASTLRDRTSGYVSLDPVIGYDTIFTREEEEKLATHIKYMASIGYGYGKTGIQLMAKEYADSLGKVTRLKTGTSSLSNCWFYGYLKRWPDLKVASPQKLSASRAEAASRENLDKYYKELEDIIIKNKFQERPERIFNVDETGINTEHSPLKIVCCKNTKAQAITSPRSAITTIIAAGNAVGNFIPPYYVFKGKRWNPDFLTNAINGANGEVSESGWSNSTVFTHYIIHFFVKHAGISDAKDRAPTLILYDGHTSHINLTLTEWAKKHNVILFVLPPHTSHLTQPLDVGIFGPFKSMYNKECQSYLQNNPGMNITKYQIAELTAKPYARAMSAENLTSAFRKTGIFPFNNQAILDSEVAPSIIYATKDSSNSDIISEKTPFTHQDISQSTKEQSNNRADRDQ